MLVLTEKASWSHRGGSYHCGRCGGDIGRAGGLGSAAIGVLGSCGGCLVVPGILCRLCGVRSPTSALVVGTIWASDASQTTTLGYIQLAADATFGAAVLISSARKHFHICLQLVARLALSNGAGCLGSAASIGLFSGLPFRTL